MSRLRIIQCGLHEPNCGCGVCGCLNYCSVCNPEHLTTHNILRFISRKDLLKRMVPNANKQKRIELWKKKIR
jgi:hypothetical protein